MEEADEGVSEVLVADGVDQRVKARLGHGQPLQVLHRRVRAPRRQRHHQRRPAQHVHDEGADVSAQQGAVHRRRPGHERRRFALASAQRQRWTAVHDQCQHHRP